MTEGVTDGLIHELHVLEQENQRLKARVARLELENKQLLAAGEELKAAAASLRVEWRNGLKAVAGQLAALEKVIKDVKGEAAQ